VDGVGGAADDSARWDVYVWVREVEAGREDDTWEMRGDWSGAAEGFFEHGVEVGAALELGSSLDFRD